MKNCISNPVFTTESKLEQTVLTDYCGAFGYPYEVVCLPDETDSTYKTEVYYSFEPGELAEIIEFVRFATEKRQQELTEWLNHKSRDNYMYINAEKDIEKFPPYVTVCDTAYPIFLGGAPQYSIIVPADRVAELERWCEENNCTLLE